MPTPMLGIGGASPTPEVGTEYNTQVTNNILRLAETVASEDIAKAKAAQVIEGKARVAQGESLESIRASQGVFDKIFGYGTIQGAEAQTVIQATDAHVLHMQTNMDQYKGMSTEEFIESQQQYVAEKLVTGNPDVDNLIVLASSEAIADTTAIHAKAHAMHIQEKNKVAFETTLQGSSKRVHSVMNDPTVDPMDKIAAVKSMQDRFSKMPGQTDAAYMSSLSDVMISELKADRPAMYQGLMQGGFEIGDTIVETGEPLQFDPSTSTKIQEAFTAYQGRKDSEGAMHKAMSYASLVQAKDNLTITDEELSDMAGQFLQEHGADAASMTQISNLFIDRGTKRLAETKKAKGILEISNGQSRLNTDRKQVANDMNLYETKLQEHVSKMPENQQQAGLENAAALVLQRSIENDVVPTSWTARWNNGFSSLVTPKGEANPAFIQTLQHFNSKYEAKPELFQKGIDAKTLGTVLGVKNLMQTEGIGVEEALVQYNSNLITPEEASVIANTKAFRAKVDEFVNERTTWHFSGTPIDSIKNPEYVKSSFKKALLGNVARTGDIQEGAFEGAKAAWMGTHEKVNNMVVPNNGVPLRSQAEMINLDASFDDAMTHYLHIHGAEKFGEGFNPENVQLRFRPGYVSITPVDELGRYLPGLAASGRDVPLKAIGRYYNEEVTKPYLQRRALKPTSLIAEAAKLTQSIFENKGAVELAKGGKISGSPNDVKVYEALQDPTKGPQIKSLLNTVPEQMQGGNTTGMLQTIHAISKLTGFIPEDEDAIANIIGE